MHGCEINSFDPTINLKSFVRFPSNIFHNVGIREEDDHIKKNKLVLERLIDNLTQDMHISKMINMDNYESMWGVGSFEVEKAWIHPAKPREVLKKEMSNKHENSELNDSTKSDYGNENNYKDKYVINPIHSVETRQMKSTWKFLPFTNITALLGHQDSIIDLLKIDVEGDEWNILASLLNVPHWKYLFLNSGGDLKFFKRRTRISNGFSQIKLRNIRQMLIEIHIWGINTESITTLDKVRQIFDNLHHLGMRLFYSCGNVICDYYQNLSFGCYTFSFVNISMLRHV
ncbi:unnamed protein product [Gordionus sp. m RMFG-2023]